VLKSAQREGKPDFNVSYMFQQTGGGYRDYYMLTLSMRLPRRKRVEAGVAEAAELVERSKKELDSQVQQQLAEVQKQYIVVTNSEELLKEYRDGLVPQAQAAYRAEQTTYESGKGTFATVLSSLIELLTFEHDYQQAIWITKQPWPPGIPDRSKTAMNKYVIRTSIFWLACWQSWRLCLSIDPDR